MSTYASCGLHWRWLWLSLLVLACAARATDVSDLKSGVFDPPRPAPAFSLRGSDGTELQLSRYRGKVVALGFGYTSCPDVCPTTLAELAAVKKKLGSAAADFQVVYVTVDPERDSVQRLKEYLGAFDPTFVGATGTPEQLADVRKAYGIVATRMPSQGDPKVYFIGHSSFIYLIDRDGALRALSPYGRSVDDVVGDVKILLTADRASGKTR